MKSRQNEQYEESRSEVTEWCCATLSTFVTIPFFHPSLINACERQSTGTPGRLPVSHRNAGQNSGVLRRRTFQDTLAPCVRHARPVPWPAMLWKINKVVPLMEVMGEIQTLWMCLCFSLFDLFEQPSCSVRLARLFTHIYLLQGTTNFIDLVVSIALKIGWRWYKRGCAKGSTTS